MLENCLSYMKGKITPDIHCIKVFMEGLRSLLDDKIISRDAILVIKIFFFC